jgi:hypothetical protein
MCQTNSPWKPLCAKFQFIDADELIAKQKRVDVLLKFNQENV